MRNALFAQKIQINECKNNSTSSVTVIREPPSLQRIRVTSKHPSQKYIIQNIPFHLEL